MGEDEEASLWHQVRQRNGRAVPLKILSLAGGGGVGRSQQSTPCHPDKGLERTQGNLPVFPGPGLRGADREFPLHSQPSPVLCLSPQTVNIGVVTSLIKASVSLKNMESG